MTRPGEFIALPDNWPNDSQVAFKIMEHGVVAIHPDRKPIYWDYQAKVWCDQMTGEALSS